MKAAIVPEAGKTPVYCDFKEPVTSSGESGARQVRNISEVFGEASMTQVSALVAFRHGNRMGGAAVPPPHDVSCW